jgi:serine/threonine-protein kinase
VPITATGVVFGTPAYLAPEAALGMGAVDARSDLYAVGVTLYEMLTGRRPFGERDPAVLFRRQRLEDPPPFRVRAPDVAVPAEAESIAMRLVQRSPTERYQTARQVVEAIDAALPVLTGAERRAPPGAASGGRRTPWAIATAIGAAVLGGTVTIVLLSGGHDRGSASMPSASSSDAPAASSSVAAAPASAPAIELEDADVSTWRGRLDKASQIKDWVGGSKAFVALARQDPGLLDDAGTRGRVIAVAAGIAHEGRTELGDAVFDTLDKRLGASGLDLLYDLALSRGGTRGGQRARAILGRPDVVERESPALRVAFEFFVASCVDRHGLLDRAAAEGDRRVLALLAQAHGAQCSNKKDPCCFREDPAMAAAIAKLRGRVGN